MKRHTQQRSALTRVIEEAKRPLSPREMHEALLALVPGAGLATVYRAIKELVEEGWLQPVNVPGEPPRYERANLPRHHHFLCRACGRLFDLEPLKTPRFVSLAPKGSVVDEEELVLKGTCAECAKVAKGDEGA